MEGLPLGADVMEKVTLFFQLFLPDVVSLLTLFACPFSEEEVHVSALVGDVGMASSISPWAGSREFSTDWAAAVWSSMEAFVLDSWSMIVLTLVIITLQNVRQCRQFYNRTLRLGTISEQKNEKGRC
mmetsp:Transcript_4482/g.9346  ORF Transcript_4482/g.9346 Transcript_4482/m.9346 type:complete len:127 (+) Transcript_4482:2059-2439(+)